MNNIIEITESNFEEEVLKSNKPILIDFWAEWCGPCRMMGPIIEEIANETEDFKVGKINIDEDPDIAANYGIESIPTLLYFKDGKVVKTLVGLRPKEDILEALK